MKQEEMKCLRVLTDNLTEYSCVTGRTKRLREFAREEGGH